MERGSDAAKVKKICIQDLRHSHISLLIEMGTSAFYAAVQADHKTIDATYRYARPFLA